MSDSKTLADLAISDTGFVFDPIVGTTFSVNPTGLCVLQSLKEGLHLDAIARRLSERFDKAPADPVRDVKEFIRLLHQHNLLTTDSAAEK